MRIGLPVWVATIIAIVIGMTGPSVSQSQDAEPSQEDKWAPNYRLKPGDIVVVSITEDRGEPIQIPIGSTGVVWMPHIGGVEAEGKTTSILATEVRAELMRTYYKNVNLSIKVAEPKEPVRRLDPSHYYVMGAVKAPGLYQTEPHEVTTIWSLIQATGGLTGEAQRKRLLLFRRTPCGNKFIQINFDWIKSEESRYNIYLRNGDIILAPREKGESFDLAELKKAQSALDEVSVKRL